MAPTQRESIMVDKQALLMRLHTMNNKLANEKYRPEPVSFVAEVDSVPMWRDAAGFALCSVAFLAGWAAVGFATWWLA